MSSLRGSSTLLNGANLALNTATSWAYVGSATDVALYIDDNGGAANWQVEVAAGTGGPGLNGVASGTSAGVLTTRVGGAFLIATTGTPVAIDLSPFGGQYIRVRPDAGITAGTVRINTVAATSRALRGSQVLWNNVSVVLNTKSAAGYLGGRTNALLLVKSDGAYAIEVAPGTGGAGLNGAPAAAATSWAALYADDGTQIVVNNLTPTTQAIDLSPISADYIRLRALGAQANVTVTLVTSD